MTAHAWRRGLPAAAALMTGFAFLREARRSHGSTLPGSDGPSPGRAARSIGEKAVNGSFAGTDTRRASGAAGSSPRSQTQRDALLTDAHSAGLLAPLVEAKAVARTYADYGEVLIQGGKEEAGRLWMTASAAILDAADGPF